MSRLVASNEDEIKELEVKSKNKNTTRSTNTWVNAFYLFELQN